jgi:hypothetical protein
MNWDRFILPNGLIKHTAPQIFESENSILETIIHSQLANRCIDGIVINWLRVYETDQTQRSHDNVTAAAVYLFLIGRMDLIKPIKILPRHIHPRDIVFITLLRCNTIGKWVLPLILLPNCSFF